MTRICRKQAYVFLILRISVGTPPREAARAGSGCPEHLYAATAYTVEMSTVSEHPARKQARLAVRLTPDQDALIRDAATAAGLSITDFVTTAAVSRAESTLADRRVFRLDENAWREFTAMLDRPAKRIPELAALLGEQAPWEH